MSIKRTVVVYILNHNSIQVPVMYAYFFGSGILGSSVPKLKHNFVKLTLPLSFKILNTCWIIMFWPKPQVFFLEGFLFAGSLVFCVFYSLMGKMRLSFIDSDLLYRCVLWCKFFLTWYEIPQFLFLKMKRNPGPNSFELIFTNSPLLKRHVHF